jgi:hypothetical protein
MSTGIVHVTVWLVVFSLSGADRPLVPAAAVVAAAPPELLERVRADPYNYFRLVNHEWTARVCEMFADDLPSQPVAQIHGDAHIEQYAFTSDAWGLDDFDDSARGPAFVDILRYLGSIELAARRRGWTRQIDRLFDRFFDGYRLGLSEPGYQTSEPGVVKRLRAKHPRTQAEFLRWADGLMSPFTDAQRQGGVAGMKVFARLVHQELPDTPDSYFDIVKAGRLRIGIGSAAIPKALFRVRGPSADPADDVIIEAKLVRGVEGAGCVSQPARRPTLRVITGARQVGRLRHAILAAGPDEPVPELAAQRLRLRDWWIRSWEASYGEVGLDDYRSPEELAAVVFDSGVQLGAGRIHSADLTSEHAAASLVAMSELEPRLRLGARTLVAELMAGWHEMRRR